MWGKGGHSSKTFKKAQKKEKKFLKIQKCFQYFYGQCVLGEDMQFWLIMIPYGLDTNDM